MKKWPMWLTTVISVLIAAAIISGGLFYVSNVQESLGQLSVTDLEQVTVQASHAFETYLQKDLQNIHGMAIIMDRVESDNIEYIDECLSAFNDIADESFYSVIDLEKGIIYAKESEIFGTRLSVERLESIKALSGSVICEPYVSEVNGVYVLACQESFTFADGVKGVIRKAFPVSVVVEEFTFSVYDGAGYSYIVNQDGDILIRSFDRDSSQTYDNVFDAMEERSELSEEKGKIIDGIKNSMSSGKSGAVEYTTVDNERFFYAYVPVGGTNGWYYIALVPRDVLMEQSYHILDASTLFIGLSVLGVFIILLVLLFVRQNNKTLLRIEREIRSREQLFDILTNSTGDAFVMYKMADKAVDYVSPNITHLLGIDAEDIKNDAKILLDSDSPDSEFAQNIAKLDVGDSVTYERRRIHRKTGEPKWLAITIYHVMIENEERAILSFSDRTVEKKREDALEDATNIAESANRAKSSFLSNMSHDIRTPMNAIVGLCTLIDRDAERPEQVRGHVRKMLASSQHLLGLINDVLDMSKIEAGKTSLNITEINLAEIVEELVTVMMPQAHAKGQTFDVSALDVRSEHLLGDKVRINQILINIISNAIKYTPDGGRIELIIREMPKKVKGFAHLRFIVNDNGNGIAPEYISHVFNAFTRESNSSTNKIQGTGLGMAITKSLVDLMEGNITVESVPGNGSTFTVDLDLKIQDRETELKFLENNGIKRILVVDDDKEACDYVVSALKGMMVDIKSALSGAEAVELSKKAESDGEGFDLILMDLKMPGMDGIEASRLIRDIVKRDFIILAFTSYDWNVVEEQAKAAGINGFMSKPFFISNLELSIERLNQEVPLLPESSGVLVGMHILVAEDNELNSDILVQQLDMLGATCDVTENGEEALQRFCESKDGEYDIILMDIQMPVLNGYEATSRIRESSHPQAKTIPILAMTADAFTEDVRRAIEAGMNAHIAKPVELNVLEEAVREALGKNNVIIV